MFPVSSANDRAPVASTPSRKGISFKDSFKRTFWVGGGSKNDSSDQVQIQPSVKFADTGTFSPNKKPIHEFGSSAFPAGRKIIENKRQENEDFEVVIVDSRQNGNEYSDTAMAKNRNKRVAALAARSGHGLDTASQGPSAGTYGRSASMDIANRGPPLVVMADNPIGLNTIRSEYTSDTESGPGRNRYGPGLGQNKQTSGGRDGNSKPNARTRKFSLTKPKLGARAGSASALARSGSGSGGGFFQHRE